MFVPVGQFAPAGAFAQLPAAVIPLPTARPIVAVFGDSLTVQSFNYIEQIAHARGWQVTGRAVGGTAPCDDIGQIERTLTTVHPTVMVVAFVGNAATKCMKENAGHVTPTPSATAAKYRSDLGRVVAVARRAAVPVWIVRPPDMANPRYAAVGAALAPLWPALAASAPGIVTILDARPALTPAGYSADLPCRDYETTALGCRNGRITVRFTDGLHLSGVYRHSNYSAGSWRYATVLVGQLPQA
jgi:hypothetical protein